MWLGKTKHSKIIKKIQGSLILILFGMFIAFLLLEAGLRILGISSPSFHTLDPYACTALRPGAAGWYVKEGRSYVQINDDGLRDRDHSLEKEDDSYRIAVLGDSFTSAFQVSVEDNFLAKMEEELSSCSALSGATIETINFGVDGHGTAQALMMYRHRALKYDPDLVLLAMTTGNDIRNNSQALDSDSLRPYYSLHDDGSLSLDYDCTATDKYRDRTTWTAQLSYKTINNFRVLQLVNQIKKIVAAQKAAKNNPQSEQELGLDTMIYFEPSEPEWIEAWGITEGLLSLLQDEAAANEAAFMVVTLTNAIQVSPDSEARQTLLAQLQVDDLTYADNRIQAYGQDKGFPVFNLAPAMLAYGERTGNSLHGFEASGWDRGHWNEGGHELAGGLMAAAVCQEMSAGNLP